MSETGYETAFGLGEDGQAPANALSTLRRLWRSADDQHGKLFIVLFCVIAYTLLSVLGPLYSAHVVDLLWEGIKASLSRGQVFHVAWDYGGLEILLLFSLYGGAWIFYTLMSFLMASFAERLSLRLRTQISEKLNRLPLSLYDRTKTGDILSRATNDLDKMSEALQTGLLKLFTAAGMITGSLIMMFQFHLGLTLIFLAFMALSLILTRIFSQKTLRCAAKRQQSVGVLTGLVEEAYTGRSVIKAFHREEESAAQIHQATQELAQASQKADFLINAINPAIRLVNRLGQVGIALLAGKLLIDGALTVGRFQAFFQYVYQAAEPLTEAAYMINSMQSALACVERTYRLLDEEEMSPEPAHPVVPSSSQGRIVFEKVAFGYAPERLLMKNISFTAEKGQKIAIVGSTGAGKTTLVNLLMRFYEIRKGRILLDGTDIRLMTRAQLRSHFGMVLQDTWLFQGTIAENIAYGRPNATREEIIAAARAARIDFFIRTLPKGYDTLLSDSEESISAGQRQLLTIARVFLYDPAVLILDEATSSVDTRTEMEISAAMKALMENRTSFVIAHRLSTIVDADLILLMEKGDIIEQGTHQQLLSKNGAYASLYYSQFS